MTKGRAFLIIALAIAAAFVALLVMARWGMGVRPDSASYLGAARQIQAGRGLTLPGPDGETLPYLFFAPLYPYVVVAASLGGDPLPVVFWLNVVLMTLNTLLSALLVYRATRSIPGAVVGAVLVAFSPDLLRNYSLTLTEPLFIFFCLLTWLFLAEYLAKSHFRMLLALSVMTGLAFLTRYSGAALLLANGLALLLLSRKPFVRRIVDIGVMGLIAVPVALLFMLNQGEGAGGRSIVYHLIPMNKVLGGAFTMMQWFLPEGLLRWAMDGVRDREPVAFVVVAALGLVVMVVLVALVTGLRRVWSVIRLGTIPSLLLLFGVIYLGFLVLSISFLDAYSWLESRMLLPIHIAVLIALTSIGWTLVRNVLPAGWPRRILTAAGILLIVSYGLQSAVQAATDYSVGFGLRGERWRNAQSLEFVRTLCPDAIIYSDNREVIYLLTGRSTLRKPFTYSFSTLLPNLNLEADIEAMRTTLESRGGYVINFADNDRAHLVTMEELVEQLNLVQLDVPADDAEIYVMQGFSHPPECAS